MTAPVIHLAHDWLVGLRGGEWVLDRLATLYGPTTLYTMVNDGRPLTPAIDACDIRTSRLQTLPAASGRLRRHYLPLYMRAVDGLRVDPCDLLISTSSAAIKSIRPPEGTPHLCYCHSPARYVWEQTEDYATGAGGRVRSLGLRLVSRRYKRWDVDRCRRVTRFLANSQHTAARIERCFDREAHVVYPPVRTDVFTIDETVGREDWLLVVGALEPYKRVDLVVDAANAAKLPLKVAGSGSQYDRLSEVAGPTVEMLGRVTDDELLGLYRRASALVFPQQEDFGIIPVEAQACGCPIIAYAAGGAMETVTNETGVFFEAQTTDAIVEAATALRSRTFDAETCRASALRFSMDVFDAGIERHVGELLADD